MWLFNPNANEQKTINIMPSMSSNGINQVNINNSNVNCLIESIIDDNKIIFLGNSSIKNLNWKIIKEDTTTLVIPLRNGKTIESYYCAYGSKTFNLTFYMNNGNIIEIGNHNPTTESFEIDINKTGTTTMSYNIINKKIAVEKL